MRYVIAICFFLSSSLYADEHSSLYSMLNNKLENPALLEEARAKGEERAFVCKYCHGEDGNSKRDYIPNLAEQNPKYLLKQFEMFASKQRDNKIMSELAQRLTIEDRVNISLFYSSQKVKTGPALPPEQLSKGKDIFQARCSTCHGSNGHGQEILPRIASQPTEYLKRTLNSYRTNPNFRPDSPMQSIVTAVNESDQETVIAYISSMN